MLTGLASEEYEAPLPTRVGVHRAHGLVKELGVDPVRRVLEPCRVEQQRFASLHIEAANRAEMAISGLAEHFARQVANNLEVFNLRGRFECNLEKFEIRHVQVGCRRVVIHRF